MQELSLQRSIAVSSSRFPPPKVPKTLWLDGRVKLRCGWCQNRLGGHSPHCHWVTSGYCWENRTVLPMKGFSVPVSKKECNVILHV